MADAPNPDRFDAERKAGADQLRLYQSAGGGASRSATEAKVAATAEALERYAAATAALVTLTKSRIEKADPGTTAPLIELDRFTLHTEQQRTHPKFVDPDAYPTDPNYTPAYDMADNSRCWVPAALVALRRDYGSLATSSGLAADFNPLKALLRAIQELVERDAYMITWLHGLAPEPIAIPDLQLEVAPLGGTIVAYDLTPRFSPHPVVCVAGSIPLRGRNRNSIGLACRSTWSEAIEKAYLEFVQGVVYVGHQLAQAPYLEQLQPETCTGFDEHAVYWTVHDEQWWDLPLHTRLSQEPSSSKRGCDSHSKNRGWASQLSELFESLSDDGISVYYRLLPTAGLDQIGLRVIRALSPDLVPIHHNHNWPNLGGTAADFKRRYPAGQPQTTFPSPHPHALG